MAGSDDDSNPQVLDKERLLMQTKDSDRKVRYVAQSRLRGMNKSALAKAIEHHKKYQKDSS